MKCEDKLPDNERNNEKLERKTILEHLMDLRRTLLFSLILIVVLFLVISTVMSKQLVQWIIQPIKDMGISIIYTNVSEAFTSQLLLSIIASCIVASPFIFVALWLFIRPALYKKERLWFGMLFIAGLIMFAVGVVFAYLVVFRLAINFFIVSGEDIAKPMLSLEKYVHFLFAFLVPFGIMFQTPIVVAVLTKLGIVNANMLSKVRKYLILLIFVIAAVLTPPDVVSQVLLALPLLVLYEISIIISRFISPRRNISD